MHDAFVLTMCFDGMLHSRVMPDMWLLMYCKELHRGCWWRGNA